MTKPFMFEKPVGMRDTLPELYLLRQQVRSTVAGEVARWGYAPIATPALEFYDTIGEASATSDTQLFKLLDQQGHTLVLRPDMTAPIARIAASTLEEVQRPARLTYDANVFRAQQREGGKPAEFEQLGVELIGDGTASADGEVIALMIAALKKAELPNFKVAIGHIGFVNTLLREILGTEERADTFRRYLYEKNYVGFKQAVKQLPLSSIDRQRLSGLLNLRGGFDILEDAERLVETEAGAAALGELRALLDVLRAYGLEDEVVIDLNLVMHMSYYTGMVFEAYSDELGFPLGGGGRYDELLEKFHRPEPATGFAVRLDRLTEALGRAKESVTVSYAIVYSNERRTEAMKKAAELREKGQAAVMQDVRGIADLDAYCAQFDNVEYLIGTNGSENSRGGAVL
ncbi:ATP phosphoribosyltransferase regulatory subunit [Alteribacter natronophilus]|uniref:ATP phosphoribosyltransferase regulatory subunit n=1 Tax=Alteribacter natronophilus TaxID=2583810 RepID=UPI00110D627E|nr:ATP phosphoribosyltransferase regulatory subunit [Alteribacter natronophilus]TMW72410.1 ATP phosphoribosyltransferase regulatory subunit [Alteribacter natronophilus]